MQSTELRIGNYFHPISRVGKVHLPLTGYIFKVIKIDLFQIEAVEYEKHPAQVETPLKFKIENLSPIPLSAEWLIKYGFEVFPWGWVRLVGDGGRKVIINYYSEPHFRAWFTVGGGLKVKIDYVHQLQNLYFALTGIELVPHGTPPPSESTWTPVKEMWDTIKNRTDLP